MDIVGGTMYDSHTVYTGGGMIYPPANTTTRAASWNQFHLPALQTLNTVAANHGGKRKGIFEFGAGNYFVDGGVQRGGLDDPDWVQRCYDWFLQNDFEFIVQFEATVGTTRDFKIFNSGTKFPLAKTKWLATFSTLPHPW